LSDEIYGSFNCILHDHYIPTPQILSHKGNFCYDTPLRRTVAAIPDSIKCSIWGPTCDGLDCITMSFTFPVLLDVDDWLYFVNMGAYTRCAATNFNGFNLGRVFYVTSEASIAKLLGLDGHSQAGIV
jgi:ornithine decarboxylase